MILVFAWPRTDHKGHTIGGGDSPKHSRMAADQGVIHGAGMPYGTWEQLFGIQLGFVISRCTEPVCA